MVSNLTPEIRMARHRVFLDANWRQIAAFAYGEYLAKGRGIVAIMEEDFVHANEPTLAPIRFKYFSAAEAPRLMSDYEGSKEQGWVGGYNPDEKVVVTVVRFDSTGVSSYLIGARPSPKELHASGRVG